MAVLAQIAGRNVIGVFADRIGSIVATKTIVRNIGVIEIRGNPASRRMTVVTGVAAGDVALILAGRDCAVVAR